MAASSGAAADLADVGLWGLSRSVGSYGVAGLRAEVGPPVGAGDSLGFGTVD